MISSNVINDNSFTKLPSVTQIKECLYRAQSFLEQEIVQDENGIGWYHFLKEGRIGILGTAAGITALSQINPRTNYVYNPAKYLMNLQIKSDDELQNGGWGIVSIGNIAICESTTWCTLALCEAGFSTDLNSVGKSVNWLLNNQNNDGGWGPAKSYISRVYSTSMAIRSLKKSWFVPSGSEVFQKAIAWMLNSQNRDGGWGEIREGGSNPIHTAHAILGLVSGGVPIIDKSIVEAINWLYTQTEKWDQAFYESYEIIKKDGSPNPRVRIDHTVLPWVVTALISAGENINQLPIKLALSKIVIAQTADGYWKSGVSERISIFELQDNVIALATALHYAPSFELTLDIHERLLLIEKEFSKFLPTLVFLSGLVNLLEITKKFLRKFYWFLMIPILFIGYVLIYIALVENMDWRHCAVTGILFSTIVSLFFRRGISFLEKVAYSATVLLGGISVILFNYSISETVASIFFSVALTVAFYLLEKKQK